MPSRVVAVSAAELLVPTTTTFRPWKSLGLRFDVSKYQTQKKTDVILFVNVRVQDLTAEFFYPLHSRNERNVIQSCGKGHFVERFRNDLFVRIGFLARQNADRQLPFALVLIAVDFQQVTSKADPGIQIEIRRVSVEISRDLILGWEYIHVWRSD